MFFRQLVLAARGVPMHLLATAIAGSAASLSACSAGPEADGDPEYSGPPSFAGNSNTATGNGSGGGFSGGSGGNAAGGSAGTPNLPVNDNTGGAVNSNDGGGAGVPAGGAPGVGGSSGQGNSAGTGGGQQTDPPVSPEGFYLIDDFEGGRDPRWIESRVGGEAGTIALDTSVGANGSSSSIRIDANNVFHTMLQFALPQAVRDANEVYGRVYLRLAATPTTAHYVWVEAGSTANDGHEMRLGHNVGQLQSNYYLNGERDIRDDGRELAANTWYCLEFLMDNQPEQLRVWLDGDETALSTTNYTAGAGASGNTDPVSDFIPNLEAFRIGWELQNGTVWFDDVALADAQIGCE